jgi:hypothetical protein
MPTTADDDIAVGTAQQWTVYAIVNGITTAPLVVNDPNATVTLMADNAGGFLVMVS